jgi:hypothetical protein
LRKSLRPAALLSQAPHMVPSRFPSRILEA